MAVFLYSGLLVALLLVLTFRVILLRRRFRVAVGSGQEKTLERAMRCHGNFTEYVPFCLFLLYLAEAQGLPIHWAHTIGSALVIGRISHAYGVAQVKENLNFRIFGMVLTMICMVSCSVFLLTKMG